ncbi:hypothetical protein BK144_30085 [Paenibacillus sp. FSL R7-0273]|nr:hypothetical protein BK144_30085 [Paenibacillus sp. FSL R7-0273]
MTAGTLSSAGTVTNLLNGTITSVLGATITAGTLSSAGTVTNLLNGTITSVLGATITAGTLSSAGTVTNLLDGTITSVLGATITAGTLSSAGTVTITSVLGATITAGTLSSVTSISQRSFIEQATLAIPTADAYTPLPANTTSVLGTYSYFVLNTGANPVNTRVEISADGTNYFVDTTGDNPLPAGSVDVIVPARFLKYTRLSYQSATPGAASAINVIFDAQGT